MPQPRENTFLRRFVALVTGYPKATILAVLAVTAILGAGLPKVYLSNERRLLLPDNDPLIAIDNKILDIYGGGKWTLIGLAPKEGDIFQPWLLEKIRDITRDLGEIPHVDRDKVISITARKVKAIEAGAEGELLVSRLVDEIPETPEEIETVRRHVMGQRLVVGSLVSADARVAAIIADIDDLDPSPELRNLILDKRIREVIARHADPRMDVHLSGLPIWNAQMDRYTERVMMLLGLAVLVIGVVHYEAFRTFQAMFLPLVTAVMSVAWAIGLLGHLGVPMDGWNSLAPFLILAVAAGHAVQILKRYYEEFRRLGDSRAAVVEATTRVGGVMLTAGLIASAGFLTLTLFPIRSVQAFGMVASFGIVSALVIEMTFIPACRTLLPAPKAGEVAAEQHSGFLERVLERLAHALVKSPAKVLAVSLALLACVVWGAFRVEVENSYREAYPVDDPVRVDDQRLDALFGGLNTFNVLVTAPARDGLYDPALLRSIDGLQQHMASLPGVGRTQSIVDYVKQMNVALNGGDESYRVIPDSREAVAQLFLLYSGDPDDFDAVVDHPYQRAVVRAFARDDHAKYCDQVFHAAKTYADSHFPPEVKVDVAGGVLAIGKAVNDLVVREKLRNGVVICGIIWLLASLVLRSPVAGILVLVPSVVAALGNIGVMGIIGSWLNLATATITALTISIGADYSIYFIFRYREEHRRNPDVRQATLATMLTAGKAIFFVASAIASGSAVICLSRLSYHRQLGGYVGLSMVTSALAAVTIVPALIILIKPRFLERIER
ncbi:MAG: RND family transporter [Deltaproteobacteria bacterium]|nr:RND family transporter [Deltaproteobacteria bacterium]